MVPILELRKKPVAQYDVTTLRMRNKVSNTQVVVVVFAVRGMEPRASFTH